ncbi:hypothetical protein [Ammoniphilus sp. YIM 78166]|uniref:hypothetical protein n=1 Tax=Ammoniphilus sp. YIM 78166 TaxID=1644106 RepID=UPI00106FB80A|nr:hypothetical protein [Ammoniphilus sp. YIM 78166]
MNKQTRQEVDKEAKKVAQEEIAHEMGEIRAQLNKITSFNPNDLMQQMQHYFEETQRQLQEMNRQLTQLTEFIQKATPLLNQDQSAQQYTATPQPYSQFGQGQMQQMNSPMNPMNPMSRPTPQQGYGQQPFPTPNPLSQFSPYRNYGNQGNQGNHGQFPSLYGNGLMNYQQQTIPSNQNRHF